MKAALPLGMPARSKPRLCVGQPGFELIDTVEQLQRQRQAVRDAVGVKEIIAGFLFLIAQAPECHTPLSVLLELGVQPARRFGQLTGYLQTRAM